MTGERMDPETFALVKLFSAKLGPGDGPPVETAILDPDYFYYAQSFSIPNSVRVVRNGVGFCQFQPGQVCFAHTEGLNGGTAVLVASSLACIMAHIPPQLEGSNNDIFILNVRQKMSEVRNGYRTYAQLFPMNETRSYVVCGRVRHHEDIWQASQVATIDAMLEEILRLPVQHVVYDILPANEQDALKGTVLMVGTFAEPARVWVDGGCVTGYAWKTDGHVTSGPEKSSSSKK
jgi:hypothetical protein